MQVQPTHCLASLPPQKQPEPQGLPGVVPLQVSSVKVGRTSFRVPTLPNTPPPFCKRAWAASVAVRAGGRRGW